MPVQYRNIKRWYLFNAARQTLAKKQPQLTQLKESEISILFTIYSLPGPVFFTAIREQVQRLSRSNNLTHGMNTLFAAGYIARSGLSYVVTNDGINYLNMLEKYIISARLDR